ncbi:hypothetical protein D3C76_1280930 [compost metagenome]
MKRLTVAGLLLLTSTAFARESPPAETERWLELQRSAEQASRNPQHAVPVERELAYRRWLESFRYAIPQWLYEDEQGSGKSGQ